MKKVSDYFTAGRIARGDFETGVGFCSNVLGEWQLSENDKKATWEPGSYSEKIFSSKSHSKLFRT